MRNTAKPSYLTGFCSYWKNPPFSVCFPSAPWKCSVSSSYVLYKATKGRCFAALENCAVPEVAHHPVFQHLRQTGFGGAFAQFLGEILKTPLKTFAYLFSEKVLIGFVLTMQTFDTNVGSGLNGSGSVHSKVDANNSAASCLCIS